MIWGVRRSGCCQLRHPAQLNNSSGDDWCVRRSGCCQLRHPAGARQSVSCFFRVRRSGCCQLRHRQSVGWRSMRSAVSVDQVVANFGTKASMHHSTSRMATCPSIRLLPTSAPKIDSSEPIRTYGVRRSGCCQLRHRHCRNGAAARERGVRRSGCCQLRHPAQLNNSSGDDWCVRRSGCCQLRHPAGARQSVSCFFRVRRSGCCQLRHRQSVGWRSMRSAVSVDQVVANFGTKASMHHSTSRMATCPSIRLLPTSAPKIDSSEPIRTYGVRRSGCCQLRHRHCRNGAAARERGVRRSGCCQLRHLHKNPRFEVVRGVRRSGCCQLRHRLSFALRELGSSVSVDQVVANFGTIHLYPSAHFVLVSVDQVVANFGTLKQSSRMSRKQKCPSIRLLPTSAPPFYPDISTPAVSVRRSGCCQLRHHRRPALGRKTEAGCPSIRLLPTSAPASTCKTCRCVVVSVDQVVANFGTAFSTFLKYSSERCPSIRLLPTSAPPQQSQTDRRPAVSVDQVVANFGT